MTNEQKAELLEAIKSYASWHGMFRLELEKENGEHELLKRIRDEKFEELNKLINNL